jgi:hypothetical protein
MNPCASICGLFWSCYCCGHIGLFSYDIIDEQYDVTNKCKDLCDKMKKKKGYERVELVIEGYEPEMMLPETGKDKMLYKSYKPMNTLYEMSEED